MHVVKGTCTFPAQTTVSFAPQEPWLQNATIRENILFGTEYDSARYRKVIYECALTPDLEILPGGDMTMVGERVSHV